VRVLLDECLPVRLGLELEGHSVSTVAQAGWTGIKNGKLLLLIQGRFDVFITVDKNLPAQQQTDALIFGILIIRTASNRLEHLRPLVPQILAALDKLNPGMVVLVQ
jgi:hypothetical protein